MFKFIGSFNSLNYRTKINGMNRYHKKLHSIYILIKKSHIPAKLIFIVMGVISTAWFLIRVIPKPQRAGYPCMQAAFPIMTGFLVWVGSITGAFMTFKLSGNYFKKAKVRTGTALVLAGVGFSIMVMMQPTMKTKAVNLLSTAEIVHPVNEPMGTSWGINPGRVVWSWDQDATDQNCPNTEADPFYASDNWDQSIVDEMITSSVLQLTSENTIGGAWDALFKSFNNNKGIGEVGYTAGQTIFIKINEGTSSWLADADLQRDYTSWKGNYDPVCETSPGVTLAILRQLVNNAGVPQENIWVADPRSHVWQHTYELLSAEFPDVKYGDRDSNHESKGRSTLHINGAATLYFSDLGEEMPDAVSEYNWKEIVDADYLINLAALKAHARAGITLTAKNHFGSTTRGGADHLHPGLVAPENDFPERTEYGMYRVQVDLMGSSVLGRNTLLFLVDGLWGSPEAVEGPVKWHMSPFNDDYPNSIFISQDQVALESVCFDFLRTEAVTGSEDDWKNRPIMAQGVDDYLHQSADPDLWPNEITYDPDNSGTALLSLGIHEHWNSASKKQYSGNLESGSGIELIAIPAENVHSDYFDAKEVSNIPVIDGLEDDDCWKTTSWLPIDQMWITWGEPLLPVDDFKGEFKVMWSSVTDKLYFLVRTTDDLFVDGYSWPDGNYPDYDILEIFIDEDHSGGDHIFDTESSLASNAFSYHIAIDEPANGSTSDSFVVCDIAGTSWGDRTTPDYAGHFPEFKVSKEGRNYIWEFSMNVHIDSYDHTNPAASLIELSTGKIMGLSMAYCDNDDPDEDPLSRDNFIGSVYVPEAAYNDHWMNADGYGVITLVESSIPVNQPPSITKPFDSFTFTEKNSELLLVTDLGEYFKDLEGDPVTFDAIAAGPDISVRIQGTILYGTASDLFYGESYITVTATDDSHAGVSQGFTVWMANSAPVVVNPIDDQVVTELGIALSVVADIETVFSDPDGDALTYETSTDDPELSLYQSGDELLMEATENFTGPSVATVTASDGALSTPTSFSVSSTVGIDQLNIDSGLKLYPNPMVDNTIHISFNSDLPGNQVVVRVLSMNRQVLYKKVFEKTQSHFLQQVALTGIGPGIYLMEIEVADQTIVRKFTRTTTHH